MSLEAFPVDRFKHSQPPAFVGSNNTDGVGSGPPKAAHRLRLSPTADHMPDSYEDLQYQLDFSPMLFSSLERYLPPPMMTLSRDAKVNYMRDILLRYSPEGERTRVLKHREYRQKILTNYKPLHRELYSMHAASFFAPSFLKAIRENTEESFRSIVSEPSPGILVFEMLQPRFCEMLLSEVDNFERWVHETNFRIMRPNTMNKYGAVLDDFGLENMLNKMMDSFVCPLAKVFFPDVGGCTLDSHHGFVVEYGMDRDVELGFHVDDSEVTLNVCLGEQFSGGELFFRGVRKVWTIPMFQGLQFFIMVATDTVLELPLLVIESTCFFGAEGIDEAGKKNSFLRCWSCCSRLSSKSSRSEFPDLGTISEILHLPTLIGDGQFYFGSNFCCHRQDGRPGKEVSSTTVGFDPIEIRTDTLFLPIWLCGNFYGHRDHPSSAPPPSTARGKDDTNPQASLSLDPDAAFLPYRSDDFLHFEMRHCLSSSPLSTAPLGTSVEHLHFNFLY
ncbi:hypothetical protein CDL15_Pgr017603 [Punica granatum]|uniref:Prolyl 4-hydroxylase alpha subunit domain-containing protein n=1 Tax=Punica granatum TaxID=22663 RepID=A0A218W5J4_PUNGR|nr:hypothetical protein CDL15_Pgr017603 [Punica granatum]